MYRVMIRDNMSPVAKKILEETGRIEVVVDNDKATGDSETLSKLIGEFDGLAVRSGTKVRENVIEKAQRLKVIGRAGIGVDNIDVGAATKRGIAVMNAPGGNTVTTAELAISLMLALARHIPQATASIREGKWEKNRFLGTEIAGKTLGIIGLGRIGRVVASRAAALEMKVIASDPYVTKEAAGSLGIELFPLDDLLSMSDFISLHVPRLEETQHLIRRATIEKMKRGVRIINCSRGEVVHLDDLHDALMQGHVAGAALDVYPTEPPDPSWPILSHPNVILTPHLGASTGEAQEKVAKMVAKQIVDYLVNGVITNAVNFPSVPTDILIKLRPILELGEKMGSLVGQVVREVNDIRIVYSGEVARFDTRIITHAVLKGLLSSFTDMPVNYINAPTLAKGKGFKIEESISLENEDYRSLIRIILPQSRDELNEVWGTIFAEKHQRIVRLGQIYMDAIPQGAMLVVQNEDRPGVIGNLGTLLARHGINIARFHLGRREGQAICMINIDTPPDEQVIKEINALPNVLKVRKIQLE